MLKYTFGIPIVAIIIHDSASVQSKAAPAAELAEWMIRQGAKFADDIAGKSVRELAVELEQVARGVGDDAMEKLVKNGGPGALNAVRGLGVHAPEAIRLIGRHGEAGKLLIEQAGVVAMSAFREFGDDGLRVLLREGASVGGRMLNVYGHSLAESTARLGPENMARLRHWLPEVEKAPIEWRSAFCEKLRQGGDDFVVWTHKRWKELAIGGGLTITALTAYQVGDGISKAMPNPAENPVAWIAWFLPAFILVGIIAAAWITRHGLITWIKARRAIRDSSSPAEPLR